MNLTVFGLLVAYDVDSGAVMATSVFMTIRILRPKWSGPQVVISGAYCITLIFSYRRVLTTITLQ